MLISERLQQFYTQNNLSKDGGENDTHFSLTFKFFSIKLPNSDFRKRIVYIHDIQHILYNKDITWKGEAFIAGWEIATDLWKHFPVNLLSLWAMGFSLLNYPKEVLQGYKQGLLVKGVIDLKISKKEILNNTIEHLKNQISRKEPRKFSWAIFLSWALISQIVLFFPLIILFIILFNKYMYRQPIFRIYRNSSF